VKASNGFIRHLWLLASLLPGLAQSRAELVTADDLKTALHDVLSHNNLFDAIYLSDRLGISLHISRPKSQDSDTTRFEGTATASPSALYGPIEYYVDVNRARHVSTAHVSFGSRTCASLRQWGSEWNIKTQAGVATDGGPSYESLVWPPAGSEAVNLVVTAGREGCGIQMSQSLRRVVSMAVSPELPHAPSGGLSKQIADLLLSDLRDYAQVGHILNTEFIVEPDSQRNGLLYHGSPVSSRVIPRFKSYVYYDGNDSGWYQPAGFFARRLHLTDRSVFLNLIADTEVLCLLSAQLTADLSQRDPQIREQRGDGRDESVFSVRGANLVSVSVTFEDGCATALRFHQVTDVARSIGDPARFTPENSLDQSKENLNDEAQRRINLLVYRLRPISIGGIEIEELPGKHPTVVVNQDLALLKRLISAALKRNGVEAPPRTNNDEAGACYQRLQPDEPAVCVDVWQ
jgi:hypothetical protein